MKQQCILWLMLPVLLLLLPACAEEEPGRLGGTLIVDGEHTIDGGERWQRLPGTLPPVLSVTCMTV